MLGSMGLATISEQTQNYFKPIQFGVGIRNGCELMINAIRARMALNPGDVCISCDAKNAFNSFDRSKIWPSLRKHFPSMEKFVRLAYLEEGVVVFQDGDEVAEVRSSIGSRQGCSLGSFLFCLAIHEELLQLQKAFPQLMIIAYCDDVYIVGDAEAAIQAYNCWSFAVSTRLQGSLRDEKGCIFSTTHHHQQLLDLKCPPTMAFSNEGIKVLGAPIGNTQYAYRHIQEKIEQIEKDINIIGYMTSHQAQWVVVVRSIQQRMQYIFRCIPCGNTIDFLPLAARYNEAILSILRRICHYRDLPNQAIKIAYLPQSLGGFGLKSWLDTADAAFLASYLYSGTIIPNFFPNLKEAFPHPSPKVNDRPSNINTTNSINLHHSLQETIPATAMEAVLANARITTTCNGIPLESIENNANLRGIQASITKGIHLANFTNLIKSIKQSPSERKTQFLARILSAMGDTYTWYTIPSDNMTTMTNCQIRIAALQRLLIPIISDPNISEEIRRTKITCPKCNVTSPTTPLTKENLASPNDIDPFGYHAFRCKADGHTPRTKLLHDRLRDVWIRLFKHAGFITTREPHGVMQDSNKRPDIAVMLDDIMHYLMLDVRTCDPLKNPEVNTCSYVPGHAADLGATTKDNDWLDLVTQQGDLFQALCHEHPGRIGTVALYALNRAATKFAQTLPQRNAFKTYWLQRLHVTNTRGVADVIIQRLPFEDQIFAPYTTPDSLPHMAQSNPHPIAFPLPQTAQQAPVCFPFVLPFSPDTTREIEPLRDAQYFS